MQTKALLQNGVIWTWFKRLVGRDKGNHNAVNLNETWFCIKNGFTKEVIEILGVLESIRKNLLLLHLGGNRPSGFKKMNLENGLL
jgi:hypothetical protein